MRKEHQEYLEAKSKTKYSIEKQVTFGKEIEEQREEEEYKEGDEESEESA